ncbi:MAG: tyrosine-type recombinase/integrase [Candidatus Thermoplasmatota archaeon]|nr:tyrosine-type recombinase/integrase [Candidatus Thermoplasmatota archaeon]
MVTIEEFLRMFLSKNTRKVYKTALKQYFDVVGIPPLSYFVDGRRYEDDVVAFLSHLDEEGKSSKSIECKIGAVRSYLLENDVELKRRFWKRIKICGEPTTKDRLFTKEELRQIFNHLDIVGRAVFQVQLSTGLRIEDVLQIKINDMHLEKNPARFYYTNHKIRKNNCVAFLTKECKETIQEWLKVREEFMLKNVWCNHVYRGMCDLGFEEWMQENKRGALLFPFTREIIYSRWWRALDCANLNERDPTTKRRVLHTHTFRQYLKTWGGTVLQESVVECLLGHTKGINDVRTIYNRYGSDCEESLAQDFLKIEHLLSLGMEDFHSKTEIEKLKKLLENQQRIIDELVKRDLNDLFRKELEMKSLKNMQLLS